MFEVNHTNEEIHLRFSSNLVGDKYLMELINGIRTKELINKSQLTEEKALQLDEELKTDWWNKNRERFLNKI